MRAAAARNSATCSAALRRAAMTLRTNGNSSAMAGRSGALAKLAVVDRPDVVAALGQAGNVGVEPAHLRDIDGASEIIERVVEAVLHIAIACVVHRAVGLFGQRFEACNFL